jgi:ribonuclease VapC
LILDTSAIVAILAEEPGVEDLLDRLGRAESRSVGSPTLVETAMVLSSRLKLDAQSVLSEFLQEFEVATVPFGESHWHEAVSAFHRFGKGRHPAALNFGDCLSYATAKIAGQPLLCVGNDFPQTDIDLA